MYLKPIKPDGRDAAVSDERGELMTYSITQPSIGLHSTSIVQT